MALVSNGKGSFDEMAIEIMMKGRDYLLANKRLKSLSVTIFSVVGK